MDIILRKETPDDYGEVARVIEMAYCQKNEATLVAAVAEGVGAVAAAPAVPAAAEAEPARNPDEP